MDARKGKAILSPACERSHGNFLEQPAKLAGWQLLHTTLDTHSPTTD